MSAWIMFARTDTADRVDSWATPETDVGMYS